jgi:phage shock protein PspC (stress-responsive transcriptional regulator)
MTISEPATLITDYLLAILTGALAQRIWRTSRDDMESDRAETSEWLRWWAAAFAASAVAGVTGGTVHGFQYALAPSVIRALWILTLESLLMAAYSVVRAALTLGWMGPRALRRAKLTAALGAGAYALWLTWSPVFLWAMVAYGGAFVVLVGCQLRARPLDASGRLLLGGVAVSLAAAAIQQSGVSLHRHFNHNDLYHVVQAMAVWLLFRGAISRGRYASAASLPGRSRP